VVRGFLKPYGRGWDDPADDDLIRGVHEERRNCRGRLGLQRYDGKQVTPGRGGAS
jgi:hypothetical protein